MKDLGNFMAEAIENFVFKPLAWIIELAACIVGEAVNNGIDSLKRYLGGKNEDDDQQPKPPTQKS